MTRWNKVHYPPAPEDPLPPERRVVLVWCGDENDSHFLPYCAYVRYSGGDVNAPFFVVYHGNTDRPTDVVAWCDCLPATGPDWLSDAAMYNATQPYGRGFPARAASVKRTEE